MVNGENTFPSNPFEPTFSGTRVDYSRPFVSLFCANGRPATGLRADFGLARITYDNYREGFCLYKMSFTREVTDNIELDGPTYVEPRQNCSSLDLYLKFSKAPTTNLGLVVMFIYSDSFEIGKDENSDRSVLLNYPL